MTQKIITLKKMKKSEVLKLFEIALAAFSADYEKYGVYPPLLKIKQKQFLPPLIFGKTIFLNDTIIGGVFTLTIGKHGEIGAIFIEPSQQHKGYGKQVLAIIEGLHPQIKHWRLETPAQSYHLHKFYESCGYLKTKEKQDWVSSLSCLVYEKKL